MKLPTAQLITVEGIEGAGKSTAARFIAEYLHAHGMKCILTREPGGTPIAEQIRQILLLNASEIINNNTELLLMFASRAQHIQQVIKPALKACQWVISDRFVDASFAYQGGGRQIPMAYIETLAKQVQADLEPCITFLLDTPIEVGLSRMGSRGTKDRIEREGIAFFERVRQSYLDRAKQHPHRFRIIDASQSEVDVQKAIIYVLEQILDQHI